MCTVPNTDNLSNTNSETDTTWSWDADMQDHCDCIDGNKNSPLMSRYTGIKHGQLLNEGRNIKVDTVQIYPTWNTKTN